MPSQFTIVTAQKNHADSRPAHLQLNVGLWTYKNACALWMPDDASDLQLRLLAIANARSFGQSGSFSTAKLLAEFFKLSTIHVDTPSFVCACTKSLSTVKGEKISRSFSPVVHDTKANDPLQVL